MQEPKVVTTPLVSMAIEREPPAAMYLMPLSPVMAAGLVLRPWGLLGRPQDTILAYRDTGEVEAECALVAGAPFAQTFMTAASPGIIAAAVAEAKRTQAPGGVIAVVDDGGNDTYVIDRNIDATLTSITCRHSSSGISCAWPSFPMTTSAGSPSPRVIAAAPARVRVKRTPCATTARRWPSAALLVPADISLDRFSGIRSSFRCGKEFRLSIRALSPTLKLKWGHSPTSSWSRCAS